MTPPLTTGFATTKFSPDKELLAPSAPASLSPEIENRLGKLLTGSVVTLMIVAGVLAYIPGGVPHPLSGVVLALTAFGLSLAFGLPAGVCAVAVMLLLASRCQLTGVFGSPLQTAGFAESLLIGLSACGAGSWVRYQNTQLAHFRREKDSLQEMTMALEKRQRLFLRDVLSAVTSNRLHLCEDIDELPLPLSPLDSATTIVLTAATLRDLRAVVRDAGTEAGMSEAVLGEFVMAVSEAAMNSVVHARDGFATISIDRTTKRVQVRIKDGGDGIDESLLHRATLEAGFSSKGSLGQGFSLMVSCCRNIHLLTGKTGTVVVLEA